MSKKCAKCNKAKPECEFSPDGRKKDGLYGRCKECRRKDRKVYYEENAEKLKDMRKRNSKKNVERVAKWTEEGSNRFRVALNKSKHNAKKYGGKMCSATIEELEAAFTGKCDACGVPEIELNKKLCVDHSHLSGDFRGFLCHRCNRALGLLGDSEAVIINLLHHLMNGVKQK